MWNEHNKKPHIIGCRYRFDNAFRSHWVSQSRDDAVFPRRRLPHLGFGMKFPVFQRAVGAGRLPKVPFQIATKPRKKNE